MASSRETAAVDQLVAAKETHRKDPTDANRKAKDKAVDKVLKVRADERANRPGTTIGGDAYIEGQ